MYRNAKVIIISGEKIYQSQMQLKSCPKGYMIETHRAVSPESTLERIEPLLPQAGITRVADITGLDRLGIPVFSCIRPTAEGGGDLGL